MGRRYTPPGYILAILATLFLSQVHGSGWLSLTMVNFTNPTGHGDNGNCCDNLVADVATCKRNPCDTYFIVCMGSPTSTDSTDEEQCNLMRFATDETDDSDAIIFGPIIPENTANPQNGTFRSWPGTFRMKVDIWDEDDSWIDTDDLIEKIRKTFTISPSIHGQPARIHELDVSKRTKLYMTLVVACDADYYGPNCTKHCRPSDDSNGHYTCNSVGNKVCQPGWTGLGCKENAGKPGNADKNKKDTTTPKMKSNSASQIITATTTLVACNIWLLLLV